MTDQRQSSTEHNPAGAHQCVVCRRAFQRYEQEIAPAERQYNEMLAHAYKVRDIASGGKVFSEYGHAAFTQIQAPAWSTFKTIKDAAFAKYLSVEASHNAQRGEA